MLLCLLYSPEEPSSTYTAEFSGTWDTKPSDHRAQFPVYSSWVEEA